MTLNTALVLFSHGSLLCGSYKLLQAHVDRIREQKKYVHVEAGYLNYSDPTIEIAIERCIAAGAFQVIIVPYFLVAGKFVNEDLPQRLESARAHFPGTEITVSRAIEDSSYMAASVLDAASNAVPVAEWQQEAKKLALEACALRSSCPLFGSPMCKAIL